MTAGTLVEVKAGSQAIVRTAADYFDLLKAIETVFEELQDSLRAFGGNGSERERVCRGGTGLPVNRSGANTWVSLGESCTTEQHNCQ
jgi:hypothetical protein